MNKAAILVSRIEVLREMIFNQECFSMPSSTLSTLLVFQLQLHTTLVAQPQQGLFLFLGPFIRIR